jgi:type I restriction enzyme M protein
MAIKKSELYKSLWASCDELRGSMDASQYKDYVLVMLFMKYVSDKVKKEKAEGKNSIIELPKGTSFYDMLEYRGKKDIGDKINTIIGEFAKANGLTGIITEADFNDDAKLGTADDKRDLLTNLLNIFNKPELDFSKNRTEGDDLLGDAYEYLMRHFATESGKSKGQFYTPAEVSRIMAKVIGINKSKSQEQTIYDPTCGSGSLLLKAADEAPKGITIYGQENDNATRALAVMNMWLHNFDDAEIVQGNTMASPEFKDDTTGELKQFDYAVANPPFSYKKWMNGLIPKDDVFKRFEGYSVPPKKNGDYAFLLHLIKSLKSKGKACIVLPLGVLFRGNAEGEIRKKIIQKGYIKGIIGLPPNLFYGTGIAACLVVIDKEKAEAEKGLPADKKFIFMIDASKGFTKDGNKNRLRDQDIHKIVDTFNNKIFTPKYSCNIPVSLIADKKNDYNLNISRYIDSQQEEDIQDIEAHLLGGIPKRDVDALEKYWTVYSSLRTCLFKPFTDRPNYYSLQIPNDQIKHTIFHHPEFTTFSEQMDKVFNKWRSETIVYARVLDKGLHPKHEIHTISENLLKHYESKPLVDKYDMYQHLMSYWAETMQDDFYELAADGWKAGNEWKRIEKKAKKGDKEVKKEVAGIEGIEGRLIPPMLMIHEYFPAEKKEIEELEADLESIVNQKIELQEEYGSEEAALQEVTSKKDAETALNECIILAMEEYYTADFKKHSKITMEIAKNNAYLQTEAKNPCLEVLKDAKGKLTQKALTGKLKTTTDNQEKKAIEDFIDVLKKSSKGNKELNELVGAIYEKLKENIQQRPEAEYLFEIAVIEKYLGLLDAETEKKAMLKKALDELEVNVINQYPKLTIDEIKKVVIERKWVESMERLIKDQLNNISYLLTDRIRELAKRYDTTLPAISFQLEELTGKVENHLREMNFVW